MPRERWAVAPGQGDHARRRRSHAGDRAHGRSRSRRYVEGHATGVALVRRDPRACRVQADVLLRLAADRALPAFAGKGGGADVILSRRYHASYLNESETRVRKAATLPSSTFMSIFITSATRRSRNEPAAVSTA